MAYLGDFDASKESPDFELKPLEEGKYNAMIVKSGSKPTASGKGEVTNLLFEICDGPYKGRKVSTYLNLKNESPEAVKIARSELSAICHAVNVMRARDTMELHNIPLVISVKCRKRQDNGEMVNVIRGYERKGAESQPAQPSGAPAPWARAA